MAVEQDGVKFIISVVDKVQGTLASMRLRFRSFVGSIKADVGKIKNAMGDIYGHIKGVLNPPWWIKIMALSAATAGVMGFARVVIGAETEAETFRARLQTLFGTDWGKAWKWAVDFAQKTPFELKDVIDQMALMKAYGLSPFAWLETIGNTAAAMGGGAETLERITRALGQMQAKTIVSAEEMRQLTEAGIPAWDILAKGIGKTVAEVMKLGETRGISAAIALPLLQKGLAERFGGGMSKQMDTIAGKWSNLKDAAWKALVDIGKAFAPVVKWLLDGLTTVVNTVADAGIGDRITAWLKRAFSNQNISTAARFFAIIKDWGSQAFKWLADTARVAFDFIRQSLQALTKLLGGPDGVWGAMQKVGRALLYFEAARAIFGVINMVSSLAQLVKDMSGKMKVVAAGALVGMSVALMTALRDYRDSAVQELQLAGAFDSWDELKKQFAAFPRFPNMNAPLTLPQMDTYNAIMNAFGGGPKGWTKPGWENRIGIREVTDPLNQIAANTANISRGILDMIYGGGPRAKMLAGRFLFGGGAQAVNINIKGGSSAEQNASAQTAGALLRSLGIPHTVRVGG